MDIQIIEITRLHPRLALLHGQLLHPPLRQRPATVPQRAIKASRRLGGALHSPEVHNRLVIDIRAPPVHHLLRQLRKLRLPLPAVNGRIYPEKTGQHPIDIPVHHRVRHPPRERADCRRRIFPNPLQRQHLRVIPRELPAVPLHDFLRRRMQVARPAIIAQALPIAHHLVLRGSRQRPHVRETLHEAAEILQPLRHSRLLENHLGNPNPVRVPRPAPRQIPAVPRVPAHQCSCKIHTPSPLKTSPPPSPA